jgi:hypothetical protein
MKKIKPEEAAEYYAHNFFNMHETNNYKALKQGFLAGDKFRAETTYTEKEVLDLLIRCPYDMPDNIKDWFKNNRKIVL